MHLMTIVALLIVVSVSMTVSQDTCIYEEKIYREQDPIDVGNPCFFCICREGGVACTGCPDYICADGSRPVAKDGDCCPSVCPSDNP